MAGLFGDEWYATEDGIRDWAAEWPGTFHTKYGQLEEAGVTLRHCYCRLLMGVRLAKKESRLLVGVATGDKAATHVLDAYKLFEKAVAGNRVDSSPNWLEACRRALPLARLYGNGGLNTFAIFQAGPNWQHYYAFISYPDYAERLPSTADILVRFLRPEWGWSDSWRTPHVKGLARGIIADGGFDRCPILADALEEAGCTEYKLLDYLRLPTGEGVTYRGDWAVERPAGYV